MSTGHEGAQLLMLRLDHANFALRPSQRSHNPVNAVAGVSVDSLNPPGTEAFNNEITYRLSHIGVSLASIFASGCHGFTTAVTGMTMF